MTRVSAAGLSVHVKTRAILHDMSFDLAAPGLVVIVGPNGAGKSTLLRALAGLLPAAHRNVRLDNRSLADLPPRERARMIGYLPQERVVHWALPARDVVALGRLPHRQDGAPIGPADQAAIEAALADMDATEFAHRPITELSGGERARVLIARVLAQQPAVILADEPTSGLDPQHQWALFEKLAAAAQRGTRIIVALHDLGLASRFARHMLLVADGRLVASGSPDKILTQERLATVFGIAATCIENDGHRLIVPIGLTPAGRAAPVP